MSLPFSDACERNKGPILSVLRDAFAQTHTVLEVGSGTGQHAVHFARHLPQLIWQPSDRSEWLATLAACISGAALANLRTPVALDVSERDWPLASVDAVFTANTLHIMSWRHVERFFEGVGNVLAPTDAVLAIYGPFRYRGAYTSQSNAAFDVSLQERDAASGIRDFEAVDVLARAQGLKLLADHNMPANNQLLLWAR